MKHNFLAACVHHGLASKMTREPPVVRYQIKPTWLPWWAWNRRPVRWLLMRVRRRD